MGSLRKIFEEVKEKLGKIERKREASFSGGRTLREEYCYGTLELKHFS